MPDYASARRDARQAFISAYPFEPDLGGLGLLLTVGLTSTSYALVGTSPQMLVTCLGPVRAHLRFYNSTTDGAQQATTACMPVEVGIPYTLTVPEGATDVACICETTSTRVQITRGCGN